MDKHPSKRTRERAYILARNAKKYGMSLKTARFSPHHDFITYWFTDGLSYVLIFCTPEGYLVEMYEDNQGQVSVNYLGVTNIRVLLSHLNKLSYKDVDEVLGEVDDYINDDDTPE